MDPGGGDEFRKQKSKKKSKARQTERPSPPEQPPETLAKKQKAFSEQPSSPHPQHFSLKSVWGQKQPQDQPSTSQKSAWGQKQSQDQPSTPQKSAWGQKQSQDQPSTPQKSAWGQKQSQDQPSSPQKSAWSQKQPQDRPSSEPAPQQFAWGKKKHDQPSSQSAPQPSTSGQVGPFGQPSSQQPVQPSAWGKKGPPGQPASPATPQPSASWEPSTFQKHTKKSQTPTTPAKEIEKVSEAFGELGKLSEDTSTPPSSAMIIAPRRYAATKSGRPIRVAANFFSLKIKNPDLIVYDYDVKITPDRPKYILRDVWNKFVEKKFPGRLTAFNGSSNAYSKGPLMQQKSISGSIRLQFEDTNKEKEYSVTVTEARKVSLKCFENYREKMLRDDSMKVLPESETTVLDIILKNGASENFIKAGPNFFSPASKNPRMIELSNKLIMRNGYYQSTFLGYELYLNFDLAHKAFYRPMRVIDLAECFTWNGALKTSEMNSFMRGVKILYELPNQPYSKRVYSVNNLVQNALTQTFKKDDGTELTVAKYLQTEKNIKLRNPEMPLVWVGSRKKTIYLPMEFCTILPDQVYRGMMNPMEISKMVRSATTDARNRKECLFKIFNEVRINNQPLLKEFGLTVGGDMEKVEGRVLDPPVLKTNDKVPVNEGTWKIKKFLEPKELKHWCILNMDKRLRNESILQMQRMLKERGRSFNMRIEDPSRDIMELNPYPRDMEKAFEKLGNMDLVIVIIPETKGVYSRVKTLCETRAKILTQCVKSRTVQQDPWKITTTVDNILLKVNAKLGGTNHMLDTTSIPDCMKGRVMIVGADVTHSSPGMNIPSVAAVAVSCDEAAFKYSTTTRVQPKGEIIRDLEDIITKHVLEFYKLRGCYPEKIIFFRDGVSEGEMVKVFTSELMAVRRACLKYCQPKITFLVVQKRHHTRFYPLSKADELGKNFNVPPGTCIDTKIVHPRDLDFYLVSHASILGTARPTRYRLLYDDNKLTDDELEKLSYYLCHLFSRCNRSVSYPSPTYNAHLAAFRVRAYLEEYRGMSDINDIQRHIKDNISDKAPMFFV